MAFIIFRIKRVTYKNEKLKHKLRLSYKCSTYCSTNTINLVASLFTCYNVSSHLYLL